MDHMIGMTSATGGVGADGRRAAQPDLWKAAEEFQTLFLDHLVSKMRESEIKSELFDGGPARGIYDGLLSSAIADRMGQADTMRMTETLYRRLGGRFAGETENVSGQ